jgi:lipoprotein-anchoring transpeptidase ErfK/SrfK
VPVVLVLGAVLLALGLGTWGLLRLVGGGGGDGGALAGVGARAGGVEQMDTGNRPPPVAAEARDPGLSAILAGSEGVSEGTAAAGDRAVDGGVGAGSAAIVSDSVAGSVGGLLSGTIGQSAGAEPSRGVPAGASEQAAQTGRESGDDRAAGEVRAGSSGLQPEPRGEDEPDPEPDPDLTGSAGGSAVVAAAVQRAEELIGKNDWLGARVVLNEALQDQRPSAAERTRLRDRLMEITEITVFSGRVIAGDGMVEEYRVKAGDSLAKIAKARGTQTHWKLIQRVNGIADPTKIRVDQRLKLVRGPFHAVVDKSDFRMDVYHGVPDRPTQWVYVMSFDVGLGMDDGTPLGSFVIGSKLENPGWVNPKNPSERYERNDPENPIGEYWLAIDGIGASARFTGFGLHGTTEPESIGRSMSLGCVRLRDEDIELVYELLEEKVSVVHIVE